MKGQLTTSLNSNPWGKPGVNSIYITALLDVLEIDIEIRPHMFVQHTITELRQNGYLVRSAGHNSSDRLISSWGERPQVGLFCAGKTFIY